MSTPQNDEFNEDLRERREQWLADYERKDTDIMEDEKGEYIYEEQVQSVEDEDGRVIEDEVSVRVYLPENLQRTNFV